MKKILPLLFMFLLLEISSANAKDVCLLSFERSNHLISKYLQREFSNNHQIHLKVEASPTDLLECISLQVKKIVIIAHGVKISSETNQNAYLGYFRRLNSREREEHLNSLEDYYRPFLSEYNPDTQPNAWTANSEISEVEYFRKNLDIPLYGPIKLFMNHFFDLFLQKVSAALASGGSLQSIYFMSCEESQIRQRYSQLKKLEQLGVKVRFAPKAKFLSWIKGEEITNFNKRWLKAVLF